MFFLVVVLLWSVQGAIVRKDVLLGDRKLSVLYDDARPFPAYALHVLQTDSTTYVVGVNDGAAETAICRRVVTKQVITNPRGCDADSPADALVDHFCEFGGELALDLARRRVLDQWTLRADSPQCLDKSACFGPVYVTAESWTPNELITDEHLLESRGGAFVVSGAGLAGEIPIITYIPMRMPRLRLYNESCLGIYNEMEFELTARDNYEGSYVNETFTLASGISRRMHLRRSGRGKFRVVLGMKGGTSDFYVDEFVSVDERARMVDVVNTRVRFQSVQNSSLECVADVVLVSAPRPFQMIEPKAPDDLTYYVDRRGSFVSMECALRRGALDEVNSLVYPDCPRNALCGGRVRFRAPGPFGHRYRVEPQAKYKDFEWSCTKFWPRGETFTALRGAIINRDAPDLLACNAPFPFPQAIEAKQDDLFEKLRQCKMLGGRGALESVSYCTMDASTTLCRLGWYFFDEFCYYKPDADRDGRFKTRQEDADATCAQIHPQARSAVSIDSYTESWLQSNYVFQRVTAECGSNPVRASVSGTRCKCYDCAANSSAPLGTVEECSCEKPEFPLCYYRIKDDYLAWNDEKMHPATLQILRDGQCMDSKEGGCMGNERYGKELECECYPGSAGQYCERRTCIVNAKTLMGDGRLLEFARRCESHGFCDEGQVDSCVCEPGYGPPSVFGVDAYEAFPCSLPMTREPRDGKSGFVVDGETYGAPLGICNGASAGIGICDAATRICRCECKTRKNMDPDGEPFEPAYDGIGCVARTAMLPANGFQINDGIVERLCNGRGTVCPSGERLGERRLDGTYLVTVDSDFCRGKLEDGCVCDNGFAGHACTVPVPYDETARDPTFFDFGAYVPIRGGRKSVKNVHVFPAPAYAGVVPTCDAKEVFVSDTTLKSERNCTKTGEDNRWWCDGAFGTYVVVNTTEERPSCVIRVYVDNHEPCGNQTDARMSRMYANEAYRDWNRTDEFQGQEYGRYGGTSTECACDANHTGKLCKTRLSSKRFDVDGVISNRACGEETFPPRGKATDEGCACNFVAGFDFGNSSGCACATTNGKLCGGVCRCVEPNFPYGTCEFDLLDEASDALSTPFADIPPLASIRNETYIMTEDSIMEFDGASWIVSLGQTFVFETVLGNVSTCYDNARYPINVTHECGQPVDVPGPRRAKAEVLIWDWVCEYEFGCEARWVGNATCDPARSCFGIKRYCDGTGTFPCLNVTRWMEDEDEYEVLVTKRYVNARVICGSASPTKTQEEMDFPYGVFPTCANPVYRWLDAALEGAGMVKKRQCADGFGPHSNVKGQAYGLFDNVIPGLNYRDETWTDAHYEFLSSLMNGEICEREGKPMWDALTDEVMDEYVLDLVRASEETFVSDEDDEDELVGEFNATRETKDVETWWGNRNWHPNTALPFGPHTRFGGYAFLPKGLGEIRKVGLRMSDNDTTVRALVLVGPKGLTCATRLKEMRVGDEMIVDCGLSFESEPAPQSARRLFDLNLTHLVNDTTWPSPYVLLYSADRKVKWRKRDVSYTTRSASYVDRWREISGRILSERVFPRNEAFVRRCVRRGGTLRLGMNRAYLREIHSVHLGRRRCTHDWQCKRFARGADHRCVPDDTTPSLLWRNGDPLTQDPVIGDEGGCDCDGVREIMDPEFHGTRCASGYEAKWVEALDYEREAYSRVRALPEWTDEYVLLNVSDWTDGRAECTLPTGSFSVGRPTSACGGGRGRLRRSSYALTRNITVYAGNKIKRCVSVIVNGEEELEAMPNEKELDLHSFGNDRMHVIYGRVFLDGEEIVRASDLKCVERTQSDTHRVLSDVNGKSFVTKPRDDWTQFIMI